MIVPDEVVIEALLKDARKFKSKWELNISEPTRSKPNTIFLKRTISSLVKTNQERMRRPRPAESYERDVKESPESSPDRRADSPRTSSHSSRKRSQSPEETKSKRHHRKSKSCSKSKHRSPSSRRKSSKLRRMSSKHDRQKKDKISLDK